MTTTAHTELVHLLVENFTELQDAVIARMNGTAGAATVAALEDPVLAGPIAVVLAHADVLARGDVRRAELTRLPAQRLRPLREYARRIRRAKSQAEKAYKSLRAHRTPTGRTVPVRPLLLRVARAVNLQAYDDALQEELAERGLPENALEAPRGHVARWAREQRLMSPELPAPVQKLLDCDDEAFVEVLLRDAREEENPYLPHDAVVERWLQHTRTALAWGRYAIAQAERAVLARTLRGGLAQLLDGLDNAYQDAAILAARAREAKHLTVELCDRVRLLTVTEAFLALVVDCHAAALVRLAATEPELVDRVRRLVAEHQADCPEQAAGCPRCHGDLAAALADGDPDPEGDTVEAGEFTPEEKDRYAILDDLPAAAVVAVADATVGDESALSGYGWAAEDGSTGYGDSMASHSGEAEVIGICVAALDLLARHPDAPVVILCDSHEAVTAVNLALNAGDPTAAYRTVLFPEGRSLVSRLLAYQNRVQVRWLKGHIGHDLNEAADALAGIALRRAAGRITEAMARRAAADATSAINGARATPAGSNSGSSPAA